MHADLRKRLQGNLKAARVDVYIACTPSNVHYTSGFQSAFIDLSWQMTGTDLVIVPADEALAPALIVSEYCAPDAAAQSDIADVRTYSMWTEGRDFALLSRAEPQIVARPEQYDTAEIFGLIADVLTERGLKDARIGSDLGLMKHETFEGLRQAFPGNELIDCRQILYEARRLKHPGEIERLRQAAKLFDAGVGQAGRNLKIGQTLDDIKSDFEAGVAEAARAPGMGTCQSTFFFPHLGTGAPGPAKRGDIVKLDCGAKVDGYWSDGCRHFCLGAPSAEQRLVHDALMAGFLSAEPLLAPGAVIGEVFQAAISAVRANGLPGYSRGHVGHSIGMDDQTEEPPFLGPNGQVLEAGMVVCLELPYYPADVGGFNIEDMFLITETGHEVLTHLPREMVEVAV